MTATTTRRKARESPVQGGPLVVVDPTAKAEKTTYAQLLREAEQRGVDVAELHEDGDFEEIDRAASDHWADAIAFAGVDETQAKAVTVASGRELPYTCIPTGRDDYFARDLGVAPDDALDALDDYSEYYVDLAEVNGVTFVNYVAVGLDCTPAQTECRGEPDTCASVGHASYLVRRSKRLPHLHWFTTSGRESCRALFVSNNWRRLEPHVISGRARLDGGVLGVGLLASSGISPIDRTGASPSLETWRWSQLWVPAFEVDADGPVIADVDGHQLSLEPPVRFRSLPRALRARIGLGSGR
jgi:diacylglycerol kinase family enzyme